MSTSIYIPERFRRAIHLHVIKNMIVRPPAREALFLGIHGPSGDGKTFQCEHVLEEMDVKAFLISGGQLEDHYAGEPAKLIRTTYLNAHRYMEKGGGKMAAIVMNDVDTGVGKWEGRETFPELKVAYEDVVHSGETLVDSGQLLNHLRPELLN